jgi:putative endonuclease
VRDEFCTVYILACGDGTLYTGWTNDVEKRLAAHNAGRGGKYTRSRLPVGLAYREGFDSRSRAMRREREIKRLSRAEKLELISTYEKGHITEVRDE